MVPIQLPTIHPRRTFVLNRISSSFFSSSAAISREDSEESHHNNHNNSHHLHHHHRSGHTNGSGGNKGQYNGFTSDEYLDRLEPSNGNVQHEKSDKRYAKRKFFPTTSLLLFLESHCWTGWLLFRFRNVKWAGSVTDSL